jgi:hypothetical protein
MSTLALYVRVDEDLIAKLDEGARTYEPPISRARFASHIIRLGLAAYAAQQKRSAPGTSRKGTRG